MILAALASAIISLFGIAASFGLSRSIEKFDLNKLQEHPTARDLQKIANAIMSKASTRGSKVYNQIADKINAITTPFGISSEASEYIAKERRRLTGLKKEAQHLMDDVANKSSELQGIVSSHEMLSTYGKTQSAGRTYEDQADDQMKEIEKTSSQFDEIEKKI